MLKLLEYNELLNFIKQGSASEATLVGLLAARETTVNRLKREHPDWDEAIIRSKLIAYTSGVFFIYIFILYTKD